ncbi:MAG: ATP-binding protein [Eubacteriales bacterium]
MNDLIYRQTIKEFEKKRTVKEMISNQRLHEIYSILPRIKKINDELNILGLQLTKILMRTNNAANHYMDQFEKKTAALNKEKIAILTSAGYSKDYLDSQYDCIQCNDTGFVNNSICSCFTKALIKKYYQQSNLEKILDIENFDNFRLDYYDTKTKNHPISPNLNIQNIFSKAIHFVKNFDTNDDNLYLYGNPGLGKTYLSHCIAKDLLDNGHSVIYQTATDLIDSIRKSKFDQSKYIIMVDCLYDCDLLIIDDLGTENLTDFSSNELFNLINRRLIDNKKHVISTNLSLKELENRYNSRLTSRIMGYFTYLKFIGEDIRLKKAKIL